ncbi:response regulator [Corallococcus sp. AB004]|uniref:response regulator n=1 Tax=Corallococcus exiguus TaxID=83462 RepID=UPI000EA1F5A4|nr:response regulator [Corallococcus exiguus]NPD22402.1 response regulator [Corallococcus exiguus]NRD43461.1 response regulator [Corallococcus exiguus]RKI50867.1 response regulator [Corallococcus sp. AB004]
MKPLLLVEDSDPDAEALMRIAKRLPLPVPVVRVRDGENALDYLYRRGAYADVERPVLILLDLHMPGINGRQVLATLKADPDLRAIPVIIFSSSVEAGDVEGAYADGANSYLFKPEVGPQLQATAEALHAFWFRAARLPEAQEPEA